MLLENTRELKTLGVDVFFEEQNIHTMSGDGELVNLRFMFGYNIRKGSITVNPIEAKIVREIFQRFVAGETLGSVAADLNIRKITAFT